jgi:very-short-patch-repair endonuclease
MYKCKFCGREFETKQQLGGHIIWCKANPNKSGKCNFNANPVKHKSYNKLRDDLFCQFCGKECKNLNSLRNHERLCKLNPNRQESPFVEFNKTREHVWNKGLTKETNATLKRSSESMKRYWGEHDFPNKGKKMSEEQKKKISISRSKFLKENPDKIPYLLNHSSKISYPEQYFIELFDRENIDLQYHKQVGLYQLDFYNEDKKLYLEIDGEQHYQEKSIERDEKRTRNLATKGWKLIMRIRWAVWKTYDENEKKKVIEIIKDSLK